MNLHDIPQKWILDSKKEKLAQEILDFLSWESNPKNFVWLCDSKNMVFIRPSVDHTITVDWACDKAWWLTIQAVVNKSKSTVNLLCTSYRLNWWCKVQDDKCPFHKDKKVIIVNPIKWID